MALRKQPDVWIEITTRTYPGGATETTRRSTKAMAFPTKIPGRVRAGSYSDIERALSDWRGHIEAAVFSWDEEDSDGQGRTIGAALGSNLYPHPEVAVKLLSEAGRKASLTPRTIQRGYLSQTPQAASNRKMKYESVDALGSKFYRFNPEAPIQSQFITREHLEAAGILKVTGDKVGKPYNIIIGEHSDRGSATSCGESAVKGMVPPDYVGKAIIPLGTVGTITSIPAPVLAATRVGATGGFTYYYAVTGIFDGGAETGMSNIVTVTGCVSWTEMDTSNYVHLHWAAPANTGGEDWASVYAGASWYRVCGRSHATPTTYLDMGFNGHSGHSPYTLGYYNDGAHDGSRIDRDVEKQLPASVAGSGACGTSEVIVGEDGTVTTEAGAWGVLIVSLGAVELLAIYGSDRATETSPARALIEVTDPDVISPLSANWPHADPFVDVNGIRLTLFYARGVLLEHHISGNVTFAVNCCGVEDIGDGSGTPITEASTGLQWLLNEIVLNHYATGAYGTLATYADGTPLIKTTSFTAMQDSTIGFIGGRGYQMHLCLTEKTSLSEVLKMWCDTFTAHIGVTQHGQISVHVIDTTTDPTTGKHYRQRMEIDGPLPDVDVAEDEVENRVVFKYDWDPDSQNYRLEQLTVQDLPSQTLYGIMDVEDDFLGLRCTRDVTTARHSMGRRIRLNRVAPVYQELPVGMIGYESNLGDIIRVTHEDGLGVAGYEEEPFFIVRQALALNGPQQRVRLVARYVGASLVHEKSGIVATTPMRISEVASMSPVTFGSESPSMTFSEVATIVISGRITSESTSSSTVQLGEVATIVATTP